MHFETLSKWNFQWVALKMRSVSKIDYIYTKRLTVHSGYTFFYQYVCSLGIEPTTFCAANAMLYHWATGTPERESGNILSRWLLYISWQFSNEIWAVLLWLLAFKGTRTQVHRFTRWATKQVYYQKSHTYGTDYVMQMSKCINLHIMHYGKSVMRS